MSKPIWIALRVLGVLVLLGLVGVAAYQFGYTNGVAQSPAIAETMRAWHENGPATAPFYPGFAGPMMRWHSPFFGGHFGLLSCGGVLGFLLLIFVFFGIMRMVFFRPWRHHHYGPWHGPTPPWAHEHPTGQAAPEQKPETPQQ